MKGVRLMDIVGKRRSSVPYVSKVAVSMILESHPGGMKVALIDFSSLEALDLSRDPGFVVLEVMILKSPIGKE